MKKIFYLFFVFVFSKTFAQQDAQYTQYMYNMSIINPAYATSDFNNLNIGLTHRRQWIGLDGSPITSSFFAHYAISDKTEGGISISDDNIGDIMKETKVSLDYAYIINLDDYQKLSFGIKAGFNFLSVNFDNINLESGDRFTDILFSKNISKFYPNVGAGAFYYTKNSYLGLSIPNLLRSSYIKSDQYRYSASTEEMHYFLTGGYVFEDDRNRMKYKPSFLVKSVFTGKISYDVGFNVLFNDNFEIGASYRSQSSASALFNINVTKNLRFGYSYDYLINELSNFSKGSHEIMLLYNFNLYGTNEKSPRYF